MQNIKDPQALNGDTIKMFATFPHAHTAGAAIWTKHVRNGIELAELFRVDNYDFNFQQTYLRHKPLEFKAGDELFTSCRYNTMDRDHVTIVSSRISYFFISH